MKSLIEEGTVRKFMKLANVGALTETFLKDNSMEEAEEEDLDMSPEEPGMGADAAPAMDEPAVDMPAEEPAMDAPAAMGGDMDKEQLMAQIVTAVASALGVEVDIEGGMGMDAPAPEAPMDEPATDLPAPEVAMEEEPPMEEEPATLEEDEEVVVERIAQRVVESLKRRGVTTNSVKPKAKTAKK